jgi:hypothetical protein
MNAKKKEDSAELDIAGLLALKAFEHPDAKRIEKNVQSTMQAVRAAHKRPTLHLFPDKSAAWMFAQPRYGIAALFILFLCLHLMNRPVSTAAVASSALEEPGLGEVLSTVSAATNAPMGIPPVPMSRQPNYSSLVQPVSFTQ